MGSKPSTNKSNNSGATPAAAEKKDNSDTKKDNSDEKKQPVKGNTDAKNDNSDVKKEPARTKTDTKTEQTIIQVPPTEEKVFLTELDDSSDAKSGSSKASTAGSSKTSKDQSKGGQSHEDEGQSDVKSDPGAGSAKSVAGSAKSVAGSEKSETKMQPASGGAQTAEERLIAEEPKDQKLFENALKSACMLVKPEGIYKHITKNVTKLHLSRALPLHFSLHSLLGKFENLKDLDISNNNLGPQCVRAVCLAMCENSTILSLNLAGNRTDTDTAESLGRMVEHNSTLRYLDVSSNSLGRDYFSRMVGPALKINTSLTTLRCESIGTTGVKDLMEGIQANKTLTELDLSSNDITDKVAFAKALADHLQSADCPLVSLSLGQCSLNPAGTMELQKGLEGNKGLQELNVAGSEFGSLGDLAGLVVTVARHPCIRTLSLDSSRVKSPDIKTDLPACEVTSPLEILGLNSCSLSDKFFTSLEKSCQGKLLSLTELDISANGDLTMACIGCVKNMTSSEESQGCLRKLRYGLNKGDNIAENLTQLPALQYINLRMCHMSADSVGAIGQSMTESSSCLSTVILDGLKLSKTTAITQLLEKAQSSKLSTLSLGGCSLDDEDITPLAEFIKAGLQLHMLKISANRITDTGVTCLVEAILKNKTHPLAVLDLSNNRIVDGGAEALARLFCTKGHTSKLHSLNVSGNDIGKAGLLALAAHIGGKSPLRTLHVHGQTSGLDEEPASQVFAAVATALGYKVQMDGEKVKPGCCDLPSNLPEGLLFNMSNHGGHAGVVGAAVDSPCVRTDYGKTRLPHLSLEHILEVCCFLKGLSTERCIWSEKEWDMITGGDRPTTDTPTWLKVTEMRDRCLYLSNLPGHTTLQKVDALLEMEADVNLDETCLMKDPVTRSINGVGWSVLSDQESVQKAVEFYRSGEAQIFSQAIMMCEVKVKVDNEASSALQSKAMVEREERRALRAKEDAAHRTLILNTAEETWKRHAYRLAHPAYADGRIW